ncbi:MAG: hypothetical protein GC192_05745 [Bacteroidetes bacterium]|nr:hypothetical protein [Bacteroidota bacterium]
MKKFITLIVFLLAITAHGQKAILGTVVLQDNFIELQHITDTADLKVTNLYKPNHFPTLSFSYLKFREKGGYNRFFLSGWHHTKIEDYETTNTSNGLTFIGGGDVKQLSGRMGYARGIKLTKKNENRILFLETDLSAGVQHDNYQPYAFNQSSRTIWAAYTRLGVNFVLQINHKNGFLRLMAMLPVIQINTEHYRVQDSFYPNIKSETNRTYLNTDAWSQKGFEIGGGLFLGK